MRTVFVTEEAQSDICAGVPQLDKEFVAPLTSVKVPNPP